MGPVFSKGSHRLELRGPPLRGVQVARPHASAVWVPRSWSLTLSPARPPARGTCEPAFAFLRWRRGHLAEGS